MPITSYSISGKVYDIDGSTVLNGATIVALDVTTAEKTSITTNNKGEFVIDLANLTSGWTLGDKIQLTASYGTGSAARSLSFRYTLSTDGTWDVPDMVLHTGNDRFGTCNITFASGTNSSAGGLYIDFYDRTNDVLVFRIEVAAGTTSEQAFGYLGKLMDGGFIRVYESAAAGSLYSAVIYK